jgi:hypothetical protein
MFDFIEKMNNGGMYCVLFDKAKTVEVDAILGSVDVYLKSLGDCENCHTHHR